MTRLLLKVFLASIASLSLACSGASFSGGSTHSAKTPAPPAPAVKPANAEEDAATSPAVAPAPPAPVPSAPVVEETASAVPQCVNHLKAGITDPKSGLHYRWVGLLSACAGYKACLALHPKAQVIFDKLVMPDEVMACDGFGYWYQNQKGQFAEMCVGLGLDVIVGGGNESDPSTPGDIICVY